MSRRTVEELKKDKFTVNENGCHIWHGATARSGVGRREFRYGKVWDGTRYTRAHRAVMESHLGRKLSAEEFVCHRCDVPLCVNVEHLFVGSNQENIADMYSKKRGKLQRETHCKRGHEYSGDNLYICPKGNRRCVACAKITNRKALLAYRERKRLCKNK